MQRREDTRERERNNVCIGLHRFASLLSRQSFLYSSRCFHSDPGTSLAFVFFFLLLIIQLIFRSMFVFLPCLRQIVLPHLLEFKTCFFFFMKRIISFFFLYDIHKCFQLSSYFVFFFLNIIILNVCDRYLILAILAQWSSKVVNFGDNCVVLLYNENLLVAISL